MDVLVFLIPIALLMGLAGLAAFVWALKSGQYEDLDGAARRILFEDGESSAGASKAPPPSPESEPKNAGHG